MQYGHFSPDSLEYIVTNPNTPRPWINYLTNEKYRTDFTPLDPESGDFVSPHFTRAYVAHLIRSKEMLGSVICSMHNVGFILNLVRGARQAILDGRFDEYRADFVQDYYHD